MVLDYIYYDTYNMLISVPFAIAVLLLVKFR